MGAEGKKLDHGVLGHGVLGHGVLGHGVLDRSFPYDELDTVAGKAYILNCRISSYSVCLVLVPWK
jgi:hypothetical protein